MTSDKTQVETKIYLKENKYFGYPSEDVILFSQESVPSISVEGQKLLFCASPHTADSSNVRLALLSSPDGNGGIYRALESTGTLQDMKRRGVECVQVFCVDNVLARVADPEFYGLCHSQNVECAAKAIEKLQFSETLGMICMKNTKLSVVEYSEISEELSSAIDPNQTEKLFLRLGNICIHYFSVGFLEKIIRNHLDDLPFHPAKKIIAGVMDLKDAITNQLTERKVAGFKMEKFIFDCFPYATSFRVKLVRRCDEFSALKNPKGANDNTSDTCLQDLAKYNRRLIHSICPSLGNEQIEDVIEVSPIYYYHHNGLKEKLKEISLRDKIFPTWIR